MTCLPSQQELPQDDELLPQDEELSLEQSLGEPTLAPASHQDEWWGGMPASCADVPLYVVPVPAGHAPWPGPAPELRAVARVPRSSQALRHAWRTIQAAP